MSFPAYLDYDEGCIESLGLLPSHWSTKRLKDVASHNDDALVETTPDDAEFLYVDISSVSTVDGIHTKETVTFADAPSRARRCVQHGDVIVSTVRTYLKAIARVIEPEDNLIVSTGFAVIRPGSDLDADFAGNLLLSQYFVDEVISRSTGVSYPAINASDLVRIRVPVPPLDEQIAIASFLDVETSKIDALVAEQRRLIELLKEKRQAVISHAVTKGLNLNAPLKLSGIQWLGDVPEHWAVGRIKYECQYESGHTPSKSNEKFWIDDDCYIPWISLNDTKTMDAADFIDDTAVKISEVGMENSSAHLIDAGAVVFNRDGARVGLAAITTKPMCVSQHIIAWVCGPNVSNHFLLHVIYAMNAEIYRITAGSTIPTIGMPDVKRMNMPLPPLAEQMSIVEFLVNERERFATLIAEAERAIELLQERRTALISAAVTGKIDVREFAYQETA